MNFVKVPVSSQLRFSGVKSSHEAIVKRRRLLLETMATVTEQFRIFTDAGISITRPGDTDDASVTTPFGTARAKFGWSMHGGEIVGTVTFEREKHDQYDRVFWEPIWGFVVPAHSDPFSSTEAGGVLLPLYDSMGSARNTAIIEAVTAIVHGILCGPAPASQPPR